MRSVKTSITLQKDNSMVLSTRTGVIVALVTDDTPNYLNYEDYRGWVLLDADTGEWLFNVTEDFLATVTLGPKLYSEEYSSVYPVLGVYTLK